MLNAELRFRSLLQLLQLLQQDAVRELLTLQEQHKAELKILHNSQQEEANARENLERKLCELRTEVSEQVFIESFQITNFLFFH